MDMKDDTGAASPSQTGAPSSGPSKNYSLAERDRRWRAVRERAGQSGLDCVFVPMGNASDARYLAQHSDAAVILPTDGRPPIVVAGAPSATQWITDVRGPGDDSGRAMAEALTEAGMERARIGVVGVEPGLVTFARFGSTVDQSAFAEVERRLPDARFVDATDVVGLVRWVKSEEELACLRQAVAAGEAGIAAGSELARPGAEGDAVFEKMLSEMGSRGCESPGGAIVVGPIDADPVGRFTSSPVGRRLERNEYLVLEPDALWGDQGTQEEQHFVLGPVPDRFRAAEELLRGVFEATCALIKPGNSVGELIAATHSFAERRAGSAGMATRPMLKGGGNGEEGPRVSPAVRAEDLREGLRDLRFVEGAVVVWKPDVYADDLKRALSWGGAVLVTPKGGQFLGKRPLSLTSLA
jgi:Xaa-Pro aminopeptidase